MKRLTDFEKFFTQGYICACATMMQDHGEDTMIRDCLKGVETDIDELLNLGVEQHDIDVLRPILDDINSRKLTPQ